MLTNPVFLLVLISFGLTIASGVSGRIPLWIPLLLTDIALLIGYIH